jgi:thiol:disulfide interchange protein
MRNRTARLSTFAALAVLCVGLLPELASAQLNMDFAKPLGRGGSRNKVALSAQFTLPQGERPGVLSITAKIPPRYHIYSLTQKAPPQKTVIKLTTSDQYQLTSGFEADQTPKFHFEEEIWPGVRIEEHEGTVTFYAPLKLAPGVNPEELVISGVLDMQLCSTSCEDVTEPFTARLSEQVVIPPAALAGGQTPAATEIGSTEYRHANSAVMLKGILEPSQVTAGSKAFLKLTATPDADWHLYTYAPQPPAEVIPGAGMATLIALTDTSGLTTYQATSPVEVQEKKTVLGDINRYHHGPVTWTVEISVPENTPAGSYPLTGLMGYQVCTDSSCQQPIAARFQTVLKVGDSEVTTPTSLSFTEAEYSAAAAAAEEYHPLLAVPEVEFDLAELLWVLPTAFLGGLILNLMPCVLPVVGLKILSLVEQAGHSRREAMQLNLAFTVGVLAVFMALATMAVALNLSWGEQFQSPTFNIVLTAILFVFAISFLGVWEIPLPGFVGSGKATQAAAQEGYAGAFFKGALSTVLATPCSGPALGAVFALTLRMPPAASYLLFLTIGLGMASPYLLVGAFPALVRWLPKPGAWMDTFKQITGFIMLAAVVVMFKFFVKDVDVVPAFGLLVGLWFGCWWIGRTPLYETRSKVIRAWVLGTILAIVCGVGGFRLLMPRDSVLPWQPFSPDKVAELTSQGKLLLVDFTPDWSLTSQMN